MSATHSIQSILPIRAGLSASILSEFNSGPAGQRAARNQRTVRTFHGAHPVRNPGSADGDAIILEIRRLHEQCNMPARAIHASLQHRGINRTYGWVYQTVNYHNRAHLTPAEGAISYLQESTTA